METRSIQVDTADGPMRLYEAQPEGDPGAAGGPRAAVVAIQEAFGVNAHIEDVARRFAEAGYHAVAPHLFHRTTDEAVPYGDFAKVMPHMQALDDEKILADVDAALDHLTNRGWGGPRIGIVGFCMGGRVTFLVAVNRILGAAVGFYGGGIVTGRFPQFPALVDQAAGLKTPWLGLFGGKDQSIPVDDVDRLRTELDASPVPHEVVLYPEAEHGFFCDERPSFAPEAAADAWKRTLGWFDAHLAVPVG